MTTFDKMKKAQICIGERNPFFAMLSLYIKLIRDEKGIVPKWAGMGVNTKGELIFKDEFVESCSGEELIGVIAHEICHLAFLHLTRRNGREAKRWNIAVDISVNRLLQVNGFQLPKKGLIPDAYNDRYENKDMDIVIENITKKTAEQIYDELPQNDDDDEGEGGFDNHIEGDNLSQTEKEAVENEWSNRTDEAVANARQRGKMPVGMDRWLDKLHNSKVDWRVILQRYITKELPCDYNWCVDKNTKVKMINGKETEIKNLNIGDRILGYKNGESVENYVIDKFDVGVNKEYTIKTKSKKIICSPEHRVLTISGYRKAKKLNIGDLIISELW